MKKIFTLGLMLLCSTALMAQQKTLKKDLPDTMEELEAMLQQRQKAPARVATQKEVLDSVVTYKGSGVIKYVDVYDYNEEGKLAKVMTYGATDSVLTAIGRKIYYTGKNQTGYKDYSYSTTRGDWYGTMGEYSETDDNGNEILNEMYLWRKDLAEWYTSRSTQKSYDTENRLIQTTTNRRFDTTTGNYRKNEFQFYAYDEAGHQTLDYYYTTDSLGTMTGDHRYELAYDDNGNQVLDLKLEGWVDSLSTWESGEKTVDYFTPDNVETLWQVWTFDPAINDFYLYMEVNADEQGRDLGWYKFFGTSSYKNVVTYDDEAHTVTTRDYSWQQSEEHPTEYLEPFANYTVRHYDADGKILKVVSHNATTDEITQIIDYIYKTITIDDTTPVNKIAASDDQSIIIAGTRITTEGAQRVAVYDLSGKLISTAAVTTVSPGTYIVKADDRAIKVQVR